MNRITIFVKKAIVVHLILTVNKNFLRAYEMNDDNFQLLKEESILNLTEIETKESVLNVINSLGSLSKYEEMSCSFFSPIATLLPESLFILGKNHPYLQFTSAVDIVPNEVDYNRLHEWKSVLLYWMPLWIKSVLVPKFPRVLIQHEQSYGLRLLTKQSLVYDQCLIHFHEDLFSLQIRKKGEIVHNGILDYQSVEDVLFHFVNTIEKLNMKEKITVFIYNENTLLSPTIEKLVNLLNSSSLSNQLVMKVEKTNHLIFHSQCV